ncbi:MAG: asparagine synthase-related protein [Rubrivivax sp.]
MSAIGGVVDTARGPDRAALERLQAVLRPYGADDQRLWLQGPCGLVRTLLRTTPEDGFDRQPVQRAEAVVLFDGRLDNRDELAAALGIAAGRAAAMADSELAAEACARWDSEAVHRLLGDWALACWQPQRQRLWLARDPLGARPLFWHQAGARFAFASLPKGLFALPGVPRTLDEGRLADLLCLLPMQGDASLFEGVKRVQPGHRVVVESGRVAAERWHRFDAGRTLRLARDEDYVEAFGEQLERAVACRLRASGLVASHLSSGFDSATVTALAARALAREGRGLVAYTAVPRAGYDGPAPAGQHVDEGPGARALARRLRNVEHVLVESGSRSPLAQLQRDIERMDRAPLNLCNTGWANAIQADAAARGVKVLLTGLAGNMSISWSGETRLPALLGEGRLGAWWTEVRALRRRERGRRWRQLLAASVAPHLPGPLWRGLQRLRGRGLSLPDYSAIHPDWLADPATRERLRGSGWDTSYQPRADGRRLRIDVLERMDNPEPAIAANVDGLELRDPTADLRLLEFCLAVPEEQSLRDGHTRWLLKRYARDLLPPEITGSPTKGLQAADWHEALAAAAPELQSALEGLQRHGRAGRLLDLASLQASLARLPARGWQRDEVVRTYRMKLLRGTAAGAFVRYAEPSNR